MKQQDTELIKQQQEDEMEIDLLEIFYLLKSKLAWLILSFILGGVIMAAVTIFLITPKYTATAKIYMAALRALNIYNGDLSIDNEDFSRISEIFSKPQSIPNTNVRTVAYMFQRSIDRISGQMLDRYSPIRKKFLKFLE